MLNFINITLLKYIFINLFELYTGNKLKETFTELNWPKPKFHKLTKIQEALFMANLPIPKRIETKSFKRSNDFGHVFCDVKKTARPRPATNQTAVGRPTARRPGLGQFLPGLGRGLAGRPGLYIVEIIWIPGKIIHSFILKAFLEKFPKFNIEYTAFYRKKRKKWKNPVWIK